MEIITDNNPNISIYSTVHPKQIKEYGQNYLLQKQFLEEKGIKKMKFYFPLFT
jgi:hypothetical protein